MRKKIAQILIILIIVFSIVSLFLSLGQKQNNVVVKHGNYKKLPLNIEIGKYQDSDCGMIIEGLKYTSQVVSPEGNTYFFHDHGGFVNWLKDKEFKDEAVIWVMSIDTRRWIKAEEAYYSINDNTPMGYGFGAYENDDPSRIDYETMKLRMLRGETLNNPKIRKQIMGH